MSVPSVVEAPVTSAQRFEDAPTSSLATPTLVPVPGVTRYITTPCPGTVALIAPVVLVTTFDHKFVSLYEADDAAPAADAVVEIVAAEAFSLNSTTETSPF